MPFDTAGIITFVLILIRVSAFLMTAPFFSMPLIPGRVRVGLALALAVALFPSVTPVAAGAPGGVWGYALTALGEAGVGLGMGYVASLVFSAITVAGQYMDLQIGFAMASLVDPASNVNTTVLAQYLFFLGMLLYLDLDGHLLLIAGLARSYQLVPLAASGLTAAATGSVVRTFAQMFVLAVQIAMPLVAVLLVIELVLGFLGRTAPQTNVFMLSFPVNVAAGLLTLAVVLPMVAGVFSHLFDVLNGRVIDFLRGWV